MEIKQASSYDLVEVLYLLRECVADMNQKGFKHWNNSYPGIELIKKDIESGSLFFYKEKGIAKGMITLTEESLEEYQEINWKDNSGKALFMQRLAVHPLWQGQGIAKALVEFAEKKAKEDGYSTLRLDVFGGGESATKVCDETGFSQSGEYHSKFQKTPYLCYEKSL